MDNARVYIRPPRDYTLTYGRLPKDEVKIHPPPALQPGQGGAAVWLQLFVPLVGSLGSLVFVFAYGLKNLLILVASIGVAVLSVGMGLAMRLQQNHIFKKRQKTERKKYMGYLDTLRAELRKTAQQQQQVNDHLYPSISKLVGVVLQRGSEQPQLWERRPEDEDFLHVRVGLGSTPLCRPSRLDLGDNPLTEYVPELRSAGEALVAECNHLENAPVTIDLKTIGVIALTGNSHVTRGLMRSILCQLAAFHSPEDVRFVAYFPPSAAHEWGWLKWLPHTRRLYQTKVEKQHAPEPLCLLADTLADFQELLSKQIARELARRHQLCEEKQEAANELMKPHIVLILDGYSPECEVAKLPEIAQLFQDSKTNGIDPARHAMTVICLVNSIRQEPSTIKARISVSDTGQLTFQKIKEGGSQLEGITVDAADLQTCEKIARSLAPLTLADKAAQQDFSQDLHLLRLLNISSADAIDTARNWRTYTPEDFLKEDLKIESPPDILKVPIGRRGDGSPLFLDLKAADENGIGPHGLVVGATGTGKSELLRTLITSLAITHDPTMVNFVLVDFKGGASFTGFAVMPHVAGIVTNLESDPMLVNRVFESLESELDRRMHMLGQAGNLQKISEYQNEWLKNPSMGPMPHLMIIVDEFAELITKHPEFLDRFVRIATQGRAPGMHLLLAAQRLEEGRLKGLETQLSYRICLRTFSAAESNIALGKPDAFYLPSAPGVGYFKVSTNIYTSFKTALISTLYVPAKKQAAPAVLIREFSATGQLLTHKTLTTTSRSSNGHCRRVDQQLRTEMEVVIQRLVDAYASGNYARVRQVSLPLLEKILPLEKLFKSYYQSDLDGGQWQAAPAFGPLRIPIGLLDKPLEQAQEPLQLDFTGAGGHLAIAGAPQSGKSTLLRTIITSFMLTHSPRDVQIYGIDLGGGLLRVFETPSAQSPHVGTVCNRMEREKIRRLIRQMHTIIEERTILFQEHGIDSMVTYRVRRQAGELSDQPFGDVFLLIDNLGQLRQDFDQLDSELMEIIATGLTYGVHVILTANRWAEVPQRLLQNIGTRLELHLHDPVESEIGKALAAALPAGIPGRGLTKDKFYFQTALPLLGGGKDSQDMQKALEALVQRTQKAWKATPAPPIKMLPLLVHWQDLPQSGNDEPPGVPIGLDEFRLAPVYLDVISAAEPHFLIFGDTECGKTNLFRVWMRGIEQRYTPEQVQFALVDYHKRLVDFTRSNHLVEYAHIPSKLKDCIEGLKSVLDKRQLLSAQIPVEQFANTQAWTGPHLFLFVDDYETLSAQAVNPLNPLVELLYHARDIGFHLILSRRVGGASASSFDQIIRRLKEMESPGLIMSGSPMEGPLLGTQKASPFPPGRGYLVRRRYPPTQVQIAFCE